MSAFRKALVATLVAAFAWAMLPATAAADNGPPTPAPGYEEFEGCPQIPPADSLGIDLCIRIEATGSLNLGDVEADIDDPMELMVGVSAGLGDDPPVVISGEGEGESEPIKVPGGLLGIEALDPLIEPLDVLNVLTIGADPQLGDPDADVAPIIVGAIFSADPDGPVDLSEVGLDPSNLGLPLSVQLENTLFGDRCYIGTPDDPIQIGLTTGETSPPEGTDPIEGSYGILEVETWNDDFDGIFRVTDNQFVDNAFAVPGAQNCNTLTSLGFGDTAIESLVNTDSLINSQTGLPSEAGQNEASFEFDFHFTLQELIYP